MSPILVGSIVLVLIALGIWGIVAAQATRRAEALVLQRLGFRPCPEERDLIHGAVVALEATPKATFEIRDPKRLDGRTPVFHYTKARKHGPNDDEPLVEDEVLFPLQRRSKDGLVLVVKPSAMASGLATRLIRAIAAAPTDRQPADLERIDVALDSPYENLIVALGPSRARLLDLVDSSTLAVVLGLGDAGALHVRFRGGWCSVGSLGRGLPFRVDQLVTRIQPLLR